MKNHFVYALYSDNVPFYVGQTSNINRRFRRHLAEAKNGSFYYVYQKIRNLLSSNKDVVIKTLESGINSNEIDIREKFFISKFRKQGINLCNLTAGGKGLYAPSKSTVVKLKKRNRSLSTETRQRISESRKGIRFSEKHRENLRTARRSRIIGFNTCEKIRQSMYGKNSKTYILKNGISEYKVNGLKRFCSDQNVNYGKIQRLLYKQIPYENWSISVSSD